MCNFIIYKYYRKYIIKFLYFQFQSNTFVDFINDVSINKKINNKILFSEKKDEKYYLNRINELENKVKILENKIK